MSHTTRNEQILKEKQYNTCAFLSSTPAVSPSHRLVSGNNINPQHVNLAKISEQVLSPYITSSNSNGTMCQPTGHRSKPIANSGVSASNMPLLSDGGFSPIDRMGGDNLIQTMIFSADETVMESSRIRPGQNVISSRNLPYPFPTPACMRNFNWNKYESLLESLNILKCFRSLEKDNNSYATLERKDQVTSARSIKRVEIKPKEKAEFIFTKEMFTSSNSEAFIQVTHFLFDLLDKNESVNRFRDSWPIYERKQEALYRRKALEWFKEIISENSKFFVKSVRLEQLQGLIVNPYGDRFIRFIHSFVDFVMFKVTQNAGEIEDPILQKPLFTRKPEISKRQGLILGARIRNLAKQAKSEQEKSIQEKLLSNLALKKMERIKEESQSALAQKQAAVSRLIKCNPEYFPEDANELLAKQAEYFQNMFKKIPFGDLWMAMEKIDSPLNEYVTTNWRKSLDSFERKVDTVLHFVSKYSRLWLFLKTSNQKAAQLELTNLYLPPEFRDIKNPRLNDVLRSYSKIISVCFKKLSSLTISQELLSQKKFLDSKLNIMRRKCEEINKIEGPNITSLKSQVDFEIKALSIELENTDWTRFSTLEETPLSTMFDFSPTRIVDTRKTTGFTPALSSYLPSVDERSLSETNKNSWAHRQVDNPQFQNEYEATSLNKQNLSTSNELTNMNPCDNLKVKLRDHTESTKGLDTCDSPISHLPPKGSFDRSAMLQSRNLNRRRSSNKCRLSLPIAEDTEPTGDKSDSVHLPNSNDNGDENKKLNDTIQNKSTVEQKLSAFLQSYTTDLRKSLEGPTVSRKSNRRSSANFRVRDKSDDMSNDIQPKLAEDLEEKLGILDITMSYANFLDLSHESDMSENELEL